MKMRIILMAVAMATSSLVITACRGKADTSQGQQDTTATTKTSEVESKWVTPVDSVEINKMWKAQDTTMIDESQGDPYLHAIIDVPSDKQNPEMANAVMEWIAEQLGVSTSSNVMDGNALLNNYYKKLKSGSDEENSDAQVDLSIRRSYETDRYLTYVFNEYYFGIGAAHGMGIYYGVTFRKSDGKVFGWNMFKPNAELTLQPFIKAALKKHFEVKTDDELMENLMIDDHHAIDYLPKPDSAPWVDADGVHLYYQSYEICCYAAGQPEVIIPIEKALPMMTAPAAKLFK